MATIKGIKLLHKRYKLDQWEKGTGLAAKPTLAFGEIGIATDVKEVRCNTSSNTEISFEAATLVSFPRFTSTSDDSGVSVEDEAYIRGIFFDNTAGASELKTITGTLPSITIEHDGTSTGSFITGLTVSKDDKHKILYTLGNAPTSSLTITSSHVGATAEDGETVNVVSGITNNASSDHDHKIHYTTIAVPTKDYVDEQVDGVKIALTDSGSGNYVNDVTLNTDGRTLTVHKATLPTIPKGSGSVEGSGTSIVQTVKLNDHTLSGTKVALKGSTNAEGGEITVKKTDSGIVFGLAEGIYATKDELSMAMVFKGTLGTSGTITKLPTASKATVGDSYKVITAGNYGAGELADCDVGDLIVCRQIESGSTATYEWIRIPAGDDANDFVSSVNVSTGLTKSGSELSPTISHKDYSSATGGNKGGSLSATDYGVSGKVITGISLDTDGLGHITSDPTVYEGDFVSEAGARTIAQEEESTTTVTGDNKITVTDNALADSKDHAYTITHASITKNNTTTGGGNLSHSGDFTAVTSITYDGTGHVSGVNTATYTLPADNNDWRPVKVNDTDFLSNTSTTPLNLEIEASDNISGITLTPNVSTGTVKFKTLGKMTAEKYGFAKLGDSTVRTIDNDNKIYGVGKNSSDQLLVYVPWENTDMYLNDNDERGHLDSDTGTDNTLRFCAIKRDHAGHVLAAEDIYTIDGNA